jgi:hypothetical protein
MQINATAPITIAKVAITSGLVRRRFSVSACVLIRRIQIRDVRATGSVAAPTMRRRSKNTVGTRRSVAPAAGGRWAQET